MVFSCKSENKVSTSGNKFPAVEINQNGNNKSFVEEQDAQVAEYVIEIFEDSKDNLWFGTMAKGAGRYDGEKFSYLTMEDGLVGNTVASIKEDLDGNLWFGTHNGASKYDGKNFTTYGYKEGLTGPGCNIMVTKSGDIWAGTNDGLFRLQGNSFEKFELPTPKIEARSYHWEIGKVWALMEDSAGNLWFGRDGYGACMYDGKSFKHFTTTDGLRSNNVNGIMEDRAGNIWFTTIQSNEPFKVEDAGPSIYDGQKITNFPEVEGLYDKMFYSIYEERSGDILICAVGKGLFRYDGKTFDLIDKTDRLDLTRNFAIQSFLEDQKGNMWLGFSGGLFRLKDSEIINVTQNGPWN